MKKIITFLLTIVLMSPLLVNAASGSYTISSSSSVEEGSTFSVTFQIKAKNMFYWQAYITYDNSKLQLVSGSTNFQGESESMSGQSSVKKTLKFKAKSKGSAWVSIAMGDKGNNINIDTQEISFSKKTKNISIVEKKVVQKKEYSSNNYLKSLSIDDFKISPDFKKDTVEYNVDLPADTTKIKVNATPEDKTASIDGIGELTVSEGINKIKIKVKAENGNIKEYTINATVLEQTPIEVTIENKKYTVIRKKDQLPKANSTYIETTTKINDQEVPALKSEITKYTLVALKDESGNVSLYKYNESNSTYTLYNEITFNKLVIVPLENSNVPSGYKKTSITIGEIKVEAYKKDKSYPIFYGLNTETGKENWYSYDERENTLQILNENISKMPLLNGISSKLSLNGSLEMYIIFGLAGFLVLTYTGILINLIKKNKKVKQIELTYEE